MAVVNGWHSPALAPFSPCKEGQGGSEHLDHKECYVASSPRSWMWRSVGGHADQIATWPSQECLSFYKWIVEPEMNFFYPFHLVLSSHPYTKGSFPFSLTEAVGFWVMFCGGCIGVKWKTAVFLQGAAALWHPQHLPCRILQGWLC